ncbi:NAD(P)-binding protein [Pseudomonadota bacterium]
MKKHLFLRTIAISAILANLLLPGLSYGQLDTEEGTGTLEIGCDGSLDIAVTTATIGLALDVAHPEFDVGAMSFYTNPENMALMETVGSGYSGLFATNTSYKNDNSGVTVTDTRNQVEGCTTLDTDEGFNVDVSVSAFLDNGDSSQTFDAAANQYLFVSTDSIDTFVDTSFGSNDIANLARTNTGVFVHTDAYGSGLDYIFSLSHRDKTTIPATYDLTEQGGHYSWITPPATGPLRMLTNSSVQDDTIVGSVRFFAGVSVLIDNDADLSTSNAFTGEITWTVSAAGSGS